MPVEIEAGSLTSTLSHVRPAYPDSVHMIGPVGAKQRLRAFNSRLGGGRQPVPR